ncbi:MAG: carboxylating nicotinate-nucleotide diphosphorylase [Deltaproteobacteria bacterium]|nr:MAG: carboxylating nicotinate-nucleotide diphosphorylase [Deltaproteobacteria bacterium]
MDSEDLIYQIIDLALLEDGRDKTSEAIFEKDKSLDAFMVAKEKGIIAGIDIAQKVFKRQDCSVSFQANVADGSRISRGEKIATIHGLARSIFKAERVALNFLQRMSGIATITAEYVKRLQGTKAKLLDTRKTVPGHRILDKLAVRLGGGMNHRMGLYDMALIKDNHIDAAGSIEKAVKKVRERFPKLPIEVEARSVSDVEELLGLGVDRIMLDNFSLEDMKEAVRITDGRIPLEASGGITLDNIREVALTGVDYISVGALTHSVKALDITLLVEGIS